jgi:hypothetical protein
MLPSVSHTNRVLEMTKAIAANAPHPHPDAALDAEITTASDSKNPDEGIPEGTKLKSLTFDNCLRTYSRIDP